MKIGIISILFTLWCSPELNQENRLPMRATFETDSKTLSLDGVWKFNGCLDPDSRQKTFFDIGFDDSTWGHMPVPGMWELNGFGDPVYICNNFAWRGHYVNNPPIPPTKGNHVGQYRRKFLWSDSNNTEDVILRIGAASSNVSIWLNGEYIGYSEDSRLAADFDITDKLVDGENTLALEIFRWCDGTYLEDQDMWRMSGISRSVELIRKPKSRLEDLNIEASASGELGIRMSFTPGVGKIDVRLYSPRGWRIWKSKSSVSGNSLNLNRKIRSPKLWSAETPDLYNLKITVTDTLGNITQTAKAEIGFRDVRVKGKQLFVNGQPILIKGINRHEITAKRGYCMTREEMEEDIRLLKSLNINAVRTAHYPNDPYWYQLCDRYGLYVMDEANIESHGIGYKPDVTLADKEEWALAHRERFTRMVQRDRNHPCVIMWSLANEAGMGRNHAANYEWAKNEDPTRPVVYQILKPVNRDLPYTDVEFYHYQTPEFCEEYLTDGKQTRPFMLQEYAHAMGNSLGNFKEYWNLIRRYPGFQGGFIWDFADQALIVGDTLMIGGDFNDYDPWNASLNCNGLLTTDRKLHPHAWEARYQMRDIQITADQNELLDGLLNIRSEFFFKTIRRARMKWELMVDGECVRSGSKRFSIKPQERKTLRLRYSCKDLSDHDVRLHLRVYDENKEISWEDLEIYTSPSVPSFGHRPQTWCISFDKNGFPTSWSADGMELLAESIRPCFGRAITENDKGAKLDANMSAWLYPELQMSDIETLGCVKETVDGWECQGEGFLRATYKVAEAGKVEMTWTVTPDGSLKLSERLVCLPDAPPLFRVGVEFALPGDFSNLDFHGAGPFETYADRKSSALIARYQQNVRDQYHAGYVRPQESGNHTDLRYMILKNNSGDCIIMTSDSLFCGSALPYSREQLDISIHEPGSIHHPKPLTWQKHHHSRDLIPDGRTHIHADLVQMGLGGIDTWKSTPLQQYMLPAGEYTFKLTISPGKAN